MDRIMKLFVRIGLLALIVYVLWWASIASLSHVADLSFIIGGPILVFPVVLLGRRLLDRNLAAVERITVFVHVAVMLLLGVPFIRALTTQQEWSGWVLPVPSEIGLALVIVTGAACLLTVANLALRGLGAPFFIVLSRKLASDWLYARTRNPMVLATLAWFLSLGVWFQSILFMLWVLIPFAPALLTYVKVYEERELEVRFGSSYVEYRSKTPFLFPRGPRA